MKGLEVFYKIRSPKENMTVEEYGKLLDIVEKELKALEIIKNNGKITQDGKYHFVIVVWNKNEEQNDLLKEVLKNE